MSTPIATARRCTSSFTDFPYLLEASCLALICWVPTNGFAIGLTELHERALRWDAELQAAGFDRAAAREQIPMARATLRPQLSLNADAGATIRDVDERSSDEFTGTVASISLSQTIFDQTTRAGVEQAEQLLGQAEIDLVHAHENLISQVATAYFDVLERRAAVRFRDVELDAIQRQLDQASRRFDVGLVSVTDVTEAEAQRDLANAARIDGINALETAREVLVVLTGGPIDVLDKLAETAPLVEPDPVGPDLWVAKALDANLDLALARQRAVVDATGIKIARNRRSPTLGIVATGAYNTIKERGQPDTAVEGDLSLQLRWSIYQGGLVTADVSHARAAADASERRTLHLERQVARLTQNAYREVTVSVTRVRAFEQALRSTRGASAASQAGFAASTRTSVDVLQALRDEFRARSDLASARYAHVMARLNLEAIAGSLDAADLVAVDQYLVSSP